MSTNETNESYEGWSSRETWAVALHINNDQGWQESIYEALRTMLEPSVGTCQCESLPADWEALKSDPLGHARACPLWRHQNPAAEAGEIIRENVKQVLYDTQDDGGSTQILTSAWLAVQDIGSLWRVNWTELGAAFLEDLDQ